MIQRIYMVTPMGKPRMTQRDKWAERKVVEDYWAFKDQCKALGMVLPESGAHVIFHLPMPKSWSKRRKCDLRGKPHQGKPDIDNLAKAVLDALYLDDSGIHSITLSKLWTDTDNGHIEIWSDQ